MCNSSPSSMQCTLYGQVSEHLTITPIRGHPLRGTKTLFQHEDAPVHRVH